MYTYIDLSKAFDTLNYDILMSKLEYYGITGKENHLIIFINSLLQTIVHIKKLKYKHIYINNAFHWN